MTICYL